MTNPTDPRIEAAAREMCLSAVEGDERIWNEMSERDKGFYRRRCALILRAADEAAWLPIESAPHNEKVILGWRTTDGEWREAFDMASYDWKCGDYARGVSRHNKATHWKPRSAGPKP